ncbi:MAG: YkgJ family cysteine cluster protein [Vicinamibacterales bacterium]
MKTFWLNFHLGYACRHSGACCSSGWPIPVEHDRVIPIRALAGRADREWLSPVTDAPSDVAGTLALQAGGHCVFHGAGGCGVYPTRPSSCVHFPYVCLIDARGVHVTLSHYCPTAASMLFDDRGPIQIVEGPSPVAGDDVPEGLDARESLPPTSAKSTAGKPNPGNTRLMSWHELGEWEREAVAGSAVEAGPPSLALFESARAAVPAPLAWPPAPDHLERTWTERVAPGWPMFAPVVARYRAAKVFASWATYLGDGPASVLRLADIAVAVLEVEVVRQCLEAGRPLDAWLLKQAIRQADLLLVHYADGRVLSSGTSS